MYRSPESAAQSRQCAVRPVMHMSWPSTHASVGSEGSVRGLRCLISTTRIGSDASPTRRWSGNEILTQMWSGNEIPTIRCSARGARRPNLAPASQGPGGGEKNKGRRGVVSDLQGEESVATVQTEALVQCSDDTPWKRQLALRCLSNPLRRLTTSVPRR